jgi:hypothetical protein
MPLKFIDQLHMMEYYDDPIEYSKVLSDGLYSDPRYLPSEDDIVGSVYLMNAHLGLHSGQRSTIIESKTAYLDLITSRTPSIAELPESHIRKAAVENATVRGEVEKFYWFGSVTMHAAGIKVGGVELIRLHTHR